MPLDRGLLDKARDASSRLAAAEHAAQAARVDYGTAIRRLHLDGGTLREIASALGLSHQRVQQIVQSAGGTWWQRLWKSRRTVAPGPCTFCGKPPGGVSKLIAGPEVFICDACVRAAERAAAPFGRASHARQRCSFCGKSRNEDRQMYASAEGNVCSECLTVCRRILTDRTS